MKTIEQLKEKCDENYAMACIAGIESKIEDALISNESIVIYQANFLEREKVNQIVTKELADARYDYFFINALVPKVVIYLSNSILEDNNITREIVRSLVDMNRRMNNLQLTSKNRIVEAVFDSEEFPTRIVGFQAADLDKIKNDNNLHIVVRV